MKYPEIDENISESQMGGRKGKGCRNNIFIINGIIHDVFGKDCAETGSKKRFILDQKM